MANFKISRLTQLLKWLVLNNSRRLGTLAGIMLGVLGFESLMNLLGGSMQRSYHLVVVQAASMAFFMMTVLLFMSPSFIMRKLDKTNKAVEFFSLPASLSEKYIASWIFVVIGGLLAFFVGFFAFDILQYLFAFIFLPGHAEWATVHLFTDGFFKAFEPSSDMQFWTMTVTGGVMFLLWAQSLYALGGTFFRKFQWLIVTVILFIFLFVLGFLVKGKVEGFDIEWLLKLKNNMVLVHVALAIFTVINYWLSFRFFKRSQVINNTFVNI